MSLLFLLGSFLRGPILHQLVPGKVTGITCTRYNTVFGSQCHAARYYAKGVPVRGACELNPGGDRELKRGDVGEHVPYLHTQKRRGYHKVDNLMRGWCCTRGEPATLAVFSPASLTRRGARCVIAEPKSGWG